MIRSLYRTQDGNLHTDLRPDEFTTALRDSGGLLWVDFVNEPPDVVEPILRETFGFHPLAIEDALRETHVPKVDDWEQYLYIVLCDVVFDSHGGGQVNTPELDVFLGQNHVVTYHDRPIHAADRVWAACQRDARHLAKGATRLLYKFADELVAGYMPVVEELDEMIELVEDQIFDRPTPANLEQILMLKRAVLHLRRMTSPQREVLNKLARDDYVMVNPDDRIYFRDVYDHLVRLHDINESLRDLIGSALDTYLSAVNNQMNEVMKTLTIITTLFMPVSFVAGFFGMNFFQAVAPFNMWTGRAAFVLTMVGMTLTPLAMYLWIRRRAWM